MRFYFKEAKKDAVAREWDKEEDFGSKETERGRRETVSEDKWKMLNVTEWKKHKV